MPSAAKSPLEVVVNELRELTAVIVFGTGGFYKKHVNLFCDLQPEWHVPCAAALCLALEVLMAATIYNQQPSRAS